jgi:hypothetical protein
LLKKAHALTPHHGTKEDEEGGQYADGVEAESFLHRHRERDTGAVRVSYIFTGGPVQDVKSSAGGLFAGAGVVGGVGGGGGSSSSSSGGGGAVTEAGEIRTLTMEITQQNGERPEEIREVVQFFLLSLTWLTRTLVGVDHVLDMIKGTCVSGMNTNGEGGVCVVCSRAAARRRG